jgi:hypothetical protein
LFLQNNQPNAIYPLGTFSHIRIHPPTRTHASLPLFPSTQRSIMRQAVEMATTHRGKTAISRNLLCTSLSRHGQEKRKKKNQNTSRTLVCGKTKDRKHHLSREKREAQRLNQEFGECGVNLAVVDQVQKHKHTTYTHTYTHDAALSNK